MKEIWDDFGPVCGWVALPFLASNHIHSAFHGWFVIKVIAKCFPQTSDVEFEITERSGVRRDFELLSKSDLIEDLRLKHRTWPDKLLNVK